MKQKPGTIQYKAIVAEKERKDEESPLLEEPASKEPEVVQSERNEDEVKEGKL
jgi:hypothetical protein